MLAEPIQPLIVRVVETPIRETTVADILLQVIGLIGVLALGAMLLGLAFGGLRIWIRRIRSRALLDADESDALHVTPVSD